MLERIRTIKGITTVQGKMPGDRRRAATLAVFGQSHPSPREAATTYVTEHGFRLVEKWT